jgi:hypothetical protein
MPHVMRTAVVLTAVLVLLSACNHSGTSSPVASDAAPRIRLNLTQAGSGTVDVVGLPADDLSRLQHRTMTRDEWAALLRVVVAGDANASADRPEVLGTYSVSDGVIRFVPQFLFDPGRRYTVVLDAARLPPPSGGRAAPWRSRRIEATISLPAPEKHATTRIVEVYPTAREVPENQLRLYIYFSAPMGLKGGLDHIRLLDETGRATEDPFLPLDVALWNTDRTRYTVLFDPGRVKRGVLPNEQMGRSLISGRMYTLVIDESWRDAEGQPLAAPFRREFRVGPSDERPIEPTTWHLDTPLAATRDPLVVSFPKPLDYGLLQRALSVWTARGERLEGDIRIEAFETHWIFTPRAPWQAAEYRLVAASILEDVAGNRIGRSFEVNTLASSRGQNQIGSAAVPFRLWSRIR